MGERVFGYTVPKGGKLCQLERRAGWAGAGGLVGVAGPLLLGYLIAVKRDLNHVFDKLRSDHFWYSATGTQTNFSR